MNTTETNLHQNFIHEIVAEDIAAGKNNGAVITRFPPEPNGYLHIGHAKAICLDFSIAAENGGQCHLRMDDTNPAKEDAEYEQAIQDDVEWLGWDWGEHLYFASDYFGQMYEYALQLINAGKAYVCDLSPDEWNNYRGTLTKPGVESPFRERSVDENLKLFIAMKNGEFADGRRVLRAKIDMESTNIHLRDPAIYRIRRATHHRTGDKWCIYPIYDFAHCLEDSIEGITHSLCTLEFEVHRPLYDWFLDELKVECHPRQIEFARLNLTYTVMSKRKLLQMVEEGHVNGWNDPRMPTISGMRRRGYTPGAIRNFCETIGVTKVNSLTDVALLEHCVREELNRIAPRFLAVMNPLKVVITNWPEGKVDELDAINNPEDPTAGERKIPFSSELLIDRNDFMEDAPKKFFRLTLGKEVRLRYGYFITCNEVIKDAAGEIIELRCSYDPETRGGNAPDGRKVKGTIHWVSAQHAVKSEVRLYDRLFTVENPGAGRIDFLEQFNPESLKVTDCFAEPAIAKLASGAVVQFERQGYFAVDPDSNGDSLVFNRTVPLRDSWAKFQQKK
ncbi:MAG: glutamine--tRNA ligase/YqeY domain fusion protein [Victivallaceae bacterium]|nr:glutamine--tRNA ligase/YqeY domain fusion protein [Victivallaceae bacterium]